MNYQAPVSGRAHSMQRLITTHMHTHKLCALNKMGKVTHGSSMYFLPSFACCSMLYPGLGSLEILSTRANRSKQLPTATSMVSPKMRYRCSLYAITCVLPPLTYLREQRDRERVVWTPRNETRRKWTGACMDVQDGGCNYGTSSE
jgi:hypothetical protein